MRVLISGSTGLIGKALGRRLMAEGHRVVRLVRDGRLPAPNGAPLGTTVRWDPINERIDASQLEGLDAVVHLAGEPVASGRWTDRKKQRILQSRVAGTELLCQALADLQHPPKVLLSASAIGQYGDRGDEWLGEDSLAGGDFLADVARQWESATTPASECGIRTVLLRLGVVLSPHGGALARMLPFFKLGLGGKLGDGQQFISWISLDDVVGAIMHLMLHTDVAGPINIVGPDPVTNEQFTHTLGRVLGRPTVMDMPLFAVRAVFGEMADNILLASQRAMAARLAQCGYSFQHPDLEDALRELIRT